MKEEATRFLNSEFGQSDSSVAVLERPRIDSANASRFAENELPHEVFHTQFQTLQHFDEIPHNTVDIGLEYERTNPYLLRWLQHLGISRETAEDVSHDTWIRVINKLDMFDSRRGAFRNWITQISKNVFLDMTRKERRHDEVPLIEDLDSTLEPPDENVNVEGKVISKIESADLQQKIRRLPESQRSVIKANFFDELTIKEISERDNIPTSTLKTRSQLGQLKLRRMFEEEFNV